MINFPIKENFFFIISNSSQANNVINEWVILRFKFNLILIDLYTINLKLTFNIICLKFKRYIQQKSNDVKVQV